MPRSAHSTQVGLTTGSVFDPASTTQKDEVGRTCRIGDRHFIYCGVVDNIAVGELISVQAPTATTNDTVTAAVGDTTLTLALAGATANQYAGGTIHFVQGTGAAGHTYRIKSHTATSSGDVTFTLQDTVITAIAAASCDYFIQPIPYKSCVEGAVAEKTVGCAVVASDGSSGEVYAWFQYKGPATVLADATTITIGDNVAAAADGKCTDSTDGVNQHIGVGGATSGASDTTAFVWLDIPGIGYERG